MIRTRFPPEPNGYLHIGHLKAMIYDFEKHPNCECILRMDDTNPEKEKKIFVDSIIEDVNWLGFNPFTITYTSDYFTDLYDFAIILIKNGLAYVDFDSPDKIKENRHNGIESDYRNMDSNMHMTHFINMKNGVYPENHCVLRLKIDMKHNNHTLRDPIAYRIKHTPHFRTNNNWYIYPSYDYSHGIVDSLENIDYSYCTTEFYVRRELYYWPLIKLNELGYNLKLPEVYEFGKLVIENGILSKRNIIKLINEKTVDNFDDPRLLTIKGLRRRGYTPEILRKIISCVGYDRKESFICEDLIKHYLREEINNNAIRLFGVIDPILVHINNLHSYIACDHKNIPSSNESHVTMLTNNIYIDASDFREINDPDYFRLAPGKIIRLRYGPFIEYVSHDKNMITCKIVEPDKPKKIKGIIHWVSADPYYNIPITYELFNNINKEIKSGFIEKYFEDVKDKPIQLERVGFFKFDREENKKDVLLMTVDLNRCKII